MRAAGKKIDFEDLEKQLKEKGYSMHRASVAMGYAKNAISNAKSRGNMTETMIRLLHAFLGIEAKEIKDATAQKEMIYYEIIYSLVYSAVTDALKDLLERIR